MYGGDEKCIRIVVGKPEGEEMSWEIQASMEG
jgi:hypothetical protein